MSPVQLLDLSLGSLCTLCQSFSERHRSRVTPATRRITLSPKEIDFTCIEGYTMDRSPQGRSSFELKCQETCVYTSVTSVLPVNFGAPPQRNHGIVVQQRRCATRGPTICAIWAVDGKPCGCNKRSLREMSRSGPSVIVVSRTSVQHACTVHALEFTSHNWSQLMRHQQNNIHTPHNHMYTHTTTQHNYMYTHTHHTYHITHNTPHTTAPRTTDRDLVNTHFLFKTVTPVTPVTSVIFYGQDCFRFVIKL